MNNRDKEMKKLLLVFLLAFSCNSMAEWIEYFTRTNGDTFFFDNARVQKNGNLINVWNRVRYKSSVMAASSYQNYIKIDCSENSVTILESTYYIDKNWTNSAMATDTKEKPKKYIDGNSATGSLANILCKE